jgi:hypothetical protein
MRNASRFAVLAMVLALVTEPAIARPVYKSVLSEITCRLSGMMMQR